MSLISSSTINIIVKIFENMSSRRSRSSRHSGGSRISEDQINDLVNKLQQLLPELRNRSSDKVIHFISPRRIRAGVKIRSFGVLTQFCLRVRMLIIYIYLFNVLIQIWDLRRKISEFVRIHEPPSSSTSDRVY